MKNRVFGKCLMIVCGWAASTYSAEFVEVSRVFSGMGGGGSNSEYVAEHSSTQPNLVGFIRNSDYLSHGGFRHADGFASSASADSDHDGLTDWQETTGLAFDPKTVSAIGSPDSDGDGLSDFEESITGTDPLNLFSCLEALNLAITDAGLRLQWLGREGRTYQVYAANTVEGLRTNAQLITVQVAGNGTGLWRESVCALTTNAPAAQQYYWVKIMP